MASLKVIRRRIVSVRSTQQVTKAMKLIAAAKLRRAQESAQNARAYAEKLTLDPSAVTGRDVAWLRQAGHSDRAIHDAAQVISYFNYINRIADGLGVDLERWMPPKSQVAE